MLVLAPVMGLAAGLGAFTAYDWRWAVLLGTVGAIAGAGIGFGWFGPPSMVPFASTFVPALTSARDSWSTAWSWRSGRFYGVVVMPCFGAPEVVDGQRLPLPVAASVAVALGVGLGGGGDRRCARMDRALLGSDPILVLVLVLYILVGKRDRIRGKAIGTAAGAAAAIPVALIDPPAWVLATLATVAFLLALTWLSKRYPQPELASAG